jgi:hypothetical protein
MEASAMASACRITFLKIVLPSQVGIIMHRERSRQTVASAGLCSINLGLAGIDNPEAQAKVLNQPSLALQACEALT